MTGRKLLTNSEHSINGKKCILLLFFPAIPRRTGNQPVVDEDDYAW